MSQWRLAVGLRPWLSLPFKTAVDCSSPQSSCQLCLAGERCRSCTDSGMLVLGIFPVRSCYLRLQLIGFTCMFHSFKPCSLNCAVERLSKEL